MVTQNQEVAVYWDFENVHAALYDVDNGNGAYRSSRGKQPRLLEVGPVLRYLHSLGHVTINRAFANWGTFTGYRRALLEHSIDLVQLFPVGNHAKNGADIRLAVEAMDDIHTHPHLSHVAILGGDSDFIPLAQKIRQAGKTVIGIGVRGSTNEYWEKACDEFTFYKTLLSDADNRTPHQDGAKNGNGRLNGSKSQLRRAISEAQGPARNKWVPQIEILDNLTKMSPELRSNGFGCERLSILLHKCSDMIEFRTDRASSPVRLNQEEDQPSPGVATPASDSKLRDTTILPPPR